MIAAAPLPVQKMHQLPPSFPLEGAIRLELQEGIPVLRASSIVQRRIEQLLTEQHERGLSPDEDRELASYEEIDDYLSLLNRMTRNLYVEVGNN